MSNDFSGKQELRKVYVPYTLSVLLNFLNQYIVVALKNIFNIFLKRHCILISGQQKNI